MDKVTYRNVLRRNDCSAAGDDRDFIIKVENIPVSAEKKTRKILRKQEKYK